MKKGIFSSLILASSLFFNSVANAGEFNSAKFERQYPNLNGFIAWNASAGVATAIYPNSMALEMAKKENNPQAFSETITIKTKQIDCLKHINTGELFKLKQKSLADNLSTQDLQILEQHYSSKVGKSETAYGKVVTNAMFKSDFNTIEKLMKDTKNPNIQVMKTQREVFEKNHQPTFKKFFKFLDTPEIKTMESKFIDSCFPDE